MLLCFCLLDICGPVYTHDDSCVNQVIVIGLLTGLLVSSLYVRGYSLCFSLLAPLNSLSFTGPMLEQDGQAFNKYWGYLSRAGLNDKSQFTRQIEKYADIYTSRVANFVRYTPFSYFRSPSQSLAHDRHFYGLQEDKNGSTDADSVS